MKDDYLTRIGKECEAELKNIGIKHGRVKEYTSKRVPYWGICKNSGGQYIILINSVLLDNKYKRCLKETIIHELLHSCPGCSNHGVKWKKYADEVNRKLGYKIKTTTSYLDFGMDPKEYAKAFNAKYMLMCLGCYQVFVRSRKSSFTENPLKYRCPDCGGIIVRAYKNGGL